jgi:hypothetical protein
VSVGIFGGSLCHSTFILVFFGFGLHGALRRGCR